MNDEQFKELSDGVGKHKWQLLKENTELRKRLNELTNAARITFYDIEDKERIDELERALYGLLQKWTGYSSALQRISFAEQVLFKNEKYKPNSSPQ